MTLTGTIRPTPSRLFSPLVPVLAALIGLQSLCLAQTARPIHRLAPARVIATRRQPVAPVAPQQATQPAPIVRQAPPAASAAHPVPAQQSRPAQTQPVRPDLATPANRDLVNPNHPNQTQQHLNQWMESHANLPLAQQQRALENEPGFRSLPSDEQQRLHSRLAQLNAMPPEQRQKVIQRNELMERLAPPQRQQVRTAMGQLGSLPEYRRHVVDQAYFRLRDMPPAQREAYMNSPQFRAQFNEQERVTINGLLAITPIWPPLQARR